jgi:hypothetical protein
MQDHDTLHTRSPHGNDEMNRAYITRTQPTFRRPMNDIEEASREQRTNILVGVHIDAPMLRPQNRSKA